MYSFSVIFYKSLTSSAKTEPFTVRSTIVSLVDMSSKTSIFALTVPTSKALNSRDLGRAIVILIVIHSWWRWRGESTMMRYPSSFSSAPIVIAS